MKPCSCRRYPCTHTARVIAHNSYRNTLRRTEAARDFPTHTCSASRHAVLIARQIMRGDPIEPVDREGCAVSILATVESLWKLRAKK